MRGRETTGRGEKRGGESKEESGCFLSGFVGVE